MIAIDLRFETWQWQSQISSTFFVFGILPAAYYLYQRYVLKHPNRYNKIEHPIKLSVPVPAEAQPHWKGKRLYAPNLNTRCAAEPTKVQCYCPATGQSLGLLTATTKAQMDQQIAQARAAQSKWARSLYSLRRKLLRTLSNFIVENQHEIASVACRDSGKTRLDALMGEIMVTLEKINWIAAHGERALRPSQRAGPSNLLLGLMKNAEVRYEPLGVVAALISWNYPFHNLMGPVVALLFTGNAIVVKCSEQVYWSSKWFVEEVLHTALRLLHLDPKLVQLCCCFPEDADYFLSHLGIDHITFIGSKPVAHKVVRAAATQLTPCVVELGGKDALIVLDDMVDSCDRLSSIIMRGTFQSAGQNCIGIERVICQPKAYERLVDILQLRVKQLRVGSDIDQLDEIDMGAMISDNRFEHMEQLISQAVAQGARLITGGKRYQHPNYPQGHYFEPTLLVDVDPHTMTIAHEECFGPILTMIRANTIDDAVSIANDTEYGLGASVFGKKFRLCSDIANRLATGNVAINDFATYYVSQLPFGGVKKSGYGKFGGEEGLQGLCMAKSVVMDKPLLRLLGVATAIPPAIDYPIKDKKKAWRFVSALNVAGYDYRMWRIIRAFKKLARGGS